MEKGKLNITFDVEVRLSVKINDFEVEGFASGFVLFHAVRKAYLDSNDMDLVGLNAFIKDNYHQVDCLPARTVEDFFKTWQLFKSNYDKRVIICEWVHSGSMFTCWNNYLEAFKDEDSFSLIYSVGGFDYELEGMGWDCSDDFKSILYFDYAELLKNKPNNQEVDFNSMTNDAVFDETGRCVFLVERNIKNFKESKLLDVLLSEVAENIISGDEYAEARTSLEQFLLSRKFQ
jgi:hypothetical protein